MPGVFANKQTFPKEGSWFRTKQQGLEEQEMWEDETRGPHLSELEGWPSLDWVRVACLSLHLEEMHRLELKVELAGMLIILNDQFPRGCQLCAQKATRIHFWDVESWWQDATWGFVITAPWNTGLLHQKGGRKPLSKDILLVPKAFQTLHFWKGKPNCSDTKEEILSKSCNDL